MSKYRYVTVPRVIEAIVLTDDSHEEFIQFIRDRDPDVKITLDHNDNSFHVEDADGSEAVIEPDDYLCWDERGWFYLYPPEHFDPNSTLQEWHHAPTTEAQDNDGLNGAPAQTVVFDVDGTLADYSGGWQAHSEKPGAPLPHVKYALDLLKFKGFKIGTFSTRNREQVRAWLEEHDLIQFIDWVQVNPDNPAGTDNKPIGHYYVDDRAIRFTGSVVSITLGIINGNYEPWQE